MHLPLQPNKRSTLLLLLLLLLPSACSVSKYIPAGELFYTGTKKITYAPNEANNQNREARKELESVLLYKPNNSLFGSPSSRLPITFPFYIHHTFAHSKNFLGKWLYRSFGSNPILISEVNPPLRATIGEQVLRENGYFSAHITPHVQLHGKDSVKASVSYQVALGTPHLLDSIRYLIPIQPTSLPLLYAPSHSLLQKGQPFSARLLAQERQRIATLLRSQGYYYFRPEHIIFQADTVQRPQKVQLRVKLSDEMLPEAYQPWQMGSITYNLYSNEDTLLPDSLLHDGILYRFNGKPPVKLHLLQPRIGIKQGALYSQAMEQSTIQRMAELNTFAYTDVSYTPRQEGGNNILDVNINSRLDLPYFTELEASYKFKSNNQTGPGASFSVNRKNLFHGGELLSILLRGSYEWETNRSSTQGNSWDINSYELGLQTSLTYPRLLIPFLTHRSFHFPHSSKVSLSGTLLNRANFYRQGQFTLDLSYRLEPTPSTRHTFTPISFSYNYIMHSTERFNEAIAQNPALALSFRNQFIPQFNYLFGYELQAPHSPHAFSLEAYIAEAGGLFSLAYLGSSKPKGEPHLFLGTPFAQFVKGTLELRYNYRANNRFQIATRAYAGAVISYGNMLVAPYLEQFYSGGANSIRGFNVRTLGPGSYRTQTTNPLDFLDRTGDLRLEANLELRYRLLGQLELATFIDVGNVWLLRPDPTRPNAHFSPQHLLNDAALGTGLGIRYDLNFLVLRFDTGLALHQPTRQGGKYFNTFLPGHKLPLAFHLAIGYPF